MILNLTCIICIVFLDKLSNYSDIVLENPTRCEKYLQFGSISLRYKNSIRKIYTNTENTRLVKSFRINHQRLNVGHLIAGLFFFTGKSFSSFLNHNKITQMNKNLLSENKEIFDQWLVGFTDGDGTFSINRQNDQKWSLTFKLSQNSYNLRIL